MRAADFPSEVAATARACADHLVAGGGGAAVVGRLRDLAALADRQGAPNRVETKTAATVVRFTFVFGALVGALAVAVAQGMGL